MTTFDFSSVLVPLVCLVLPTIAIVYIYIYIQKNRLF
nr:photosystem I subunit VIII [Tussilago farfara]